MQLRLALAACVVVACAMCGRSLAGAAERRCRILTDLLAALRRLRIEIGSMLEPLQGALIRTDFPLFSAVAQGLKAAESASAAWLLVKERESRRGGSADCLTQHDLAALDRLFENLGESGRESQAEAIGGCIASVEASLIEAKERSEQVGKLYTSLGFLMGLALAVLMM